MQAISQYKYGNKHISRGEVTDLLPSNFFIQREMEKLRFVFAIINSLSEHQIFIYKSEWI